MALARTNRAGSSSSSNVTGYPTASFSLASGDLVVAVCALAGAGTLTIAGHSLTWNNLGGTNTQLWNTGSTDRLQVWYAIAPTGSTGTVTFTASVAGGGACWSIFSYTGYDTGTPLSSGLGMTDTDNPAGPLDVSSLTGALTVWATARNTNAADGSHSGATTIHNPTHTAPTRNLIVFEEAGENSPTAAWASNFLAGMIALKVRQATDGTITLPLLDGGRALHAPTVASAGADEVILPLLSGGKTLHAPTVAGEVTLPLLDGARALHAPAVEVTPLVWEFAPTSLTLGTYTGAVSNVAEWPPVTGPGERLEDANISGSGTGSGSAFFDMSNSIAFDRGLLFVMSHHGSTSSGFVVNCVVKVGGVEVSDPVQVSREGGAGANLWSFFHWDSTLIDLADLEADPTTVEIAWIATNMDSGLQSHRINAMRLFVSPFSGTPSLPGGLDPADFLAIYSPRLWGGLYDDGDTIPHVPDLLGSAHLIRSQGSMTYDDDDAALGIVGVPSGALFGGQLQTIALSAWIVHFARTPATVPTNDSVSQALLSNFGLEGDPSINVGSQILYGALAAGSGASGGMVIMVESDNTHIRTDGWNGAGTNFPASTGFCVLIRSHESDTERIYVELNTPLTAGSLRVDDDSEVGGTFWVQSLGLMNRGDASRAWQGTWGGTYLLPISLSEAEVLDIVEVLGVEHGLWVAGDEIDLPLLVGGIASHAPSVHGGLELPLLSGARAAHAPVVAEAAADLVTLPLLDGARALHGPAVTGSLELPLLDGARVLHAPAVSGLVGLPLLDGARALTAPEVAGAVALPHLNGLRDLHAPALTGALELPPLVGGRQPHAPVVSSELGLPLLVGARALHAPALVNSTVQLPRLDGARAVHAPALAGVVDLPALAGARAVHAPALAHSSVELPLLVGGRLPHPPAVAGEVALPLLDAAAALHLPTLTGEGTVALALLDGGRAVHAPTIVGDGFVVLPSLDGGRTLHAPLVAASSLALPRLDGLRSLPAPTLTASSIDLPRLDGARTPHAPLVGGSSLELPLLTGGRALHAPAVLNASVLLPLLDGAHLIHAPAVGGGVALDLLDGARALHPPALTGLGFIVLPLLDGGRTPHPPTLAGPVLAYVYALGEPTAYGKVTSGREDGDLVLSGREPGL